MNHLKRWLPSLLMMAVIFGFSSIPSVEMPTFGGFDYVLKKLGHAIGYALLALANLRGLKKPNHEVHEEKHPSPFMSFISFVTKHPAFFSWLMAVTFSATDEFHQSFVPGRNPSVWDVLIFDNLGAIAGLWIHRIFDERVKPDMSP